MSDSPIFDMLDGEHGRYTKTMEETKKSLQKYTHPLIARVVPAVEEPEVIAQPFTKVQGVLRGTFGEFTKEPVSQPGIDLTAKVLGVPVPIVEDQRSLYEPENHGKYELIRQETKFDPMDLEEKGVGFTEFALQTLDRFKLENPLVERINFFIDSDYSFYGTLERFVIEGQKPRIDNPDEIMARPVDTVAMFGAELIGAQDVPEGVLLAYRTAVAEQHPGFVVSAVTGIQEHEDGSATLALEGQQIMASKPFLEEGDLADDVGPTEFEKKSLKYFAEKTGETVKPLSEKNTAQIME